MLALSRERFPPAGRIPTVLLVRVCRDEDQFRTYGASEVRPQAGSLAWFLSMQEDPRWKGIPERPLAALRDHLAALGPEPHRRASREGVETAREAAWKAAFGALTDADWTAMEKAWRAFPG